MRAVGLFIQHGRESAPAPGRRDLPAIQQPGERQDRPSPMRPRKTKSSFSRLAPTSSFAGAMMSRRAFASISLKPSMGSRTEPCSMRSSSPPFATAALSPPSAALRASCSGISASRQPGCAPMRTSGRSSIGCANWSRPAKSRFGHASRGGAIPAGKGGRRPSPAGGWRDERTAGHSILIKETSLRVGRARSAGAAQGGERRQ
jgi:hypothetical protein